MLSCFQVISERTQPRRDRATTKIVVASALLCIAASFAAANERVTFVGVALDQETREADRRLQDYLQRSTDIRFAPEELEYGQVIERLADWDPAGGVVIARTTPYVQVVSEMLGAELEILATYVSEATGRTTYHSYFIARRERLPPNPTPMDVISLVTASPSRLRFLYHNLFSTSSYFLPSLYFRANGVFHMAEATESLAAIEVSQSDINSSSYLVRAVASGEADLAAVFDGTRARFVEASGSTVDAAWPNGSVRAAAIGDTQRPPGVFAFGAGRPQREHPVRQSARCRRRRSRSVISHAGSKSATLGGPGRPCPSPVAGAREGRASYGRRAAGARDPDRYKDHGEGGAPRRAVVGNRVRALRRGLPRAHRFACGRSTRSTTARPVSKLDPRHRHRRSGLPDQLPRPSGSDPSHRRHPRDASIVSATCGPTAAASRS